MINPNRRLSNGFLVKIWELITWIYMDLGYWSEPSFQLFLRLKNCLTDGRTFLLVQWVQLVGGRFSAGNNWRFFHFALNEIIDMVFLLPAQRLCGSEKWWSYRAISKISTLWRWRLVEKERSSLNRKAKIVQKGDDRHFMLLLLIIKMGEGMITLSAPTWSKHITKKDDRILFCPH